MALKMKLGAEEFEKVRALPGTVEALAAHVGLKDDVIAAIYEAGGFDGTDDYSTTAFQPG